MIILRTLAHGVMSHAGVRFTEWLGAVPLLGIGAVLHFDPDVFERTASFLVLSAWAAGATWALVILCVALARLLALAINGSFKGFTHSPTIRWGASCVAALFWMLFLVGVFTAWREAGGSPTPIVAYGTLLLLELRNVYVSRVDMAIARGASNARSNP